MTIVRLEDLASVRPPVWVRGPDGSGLRIDESDERTLRNFGYATLLEINDPPPAGFIEVGRERLLIDGNPVDRPLFEPIQLAEVAISTAIAAIDQAQIVLDQTGANLSAAMESLAAARNALADVG